VSLSSVPAGTSRPNRLAARYTRRSSAEPSFPIDPATRRPIVSRERRVRVALGGSQAQKDPKVPSTATNLGSAHWNPKSKNSKVGSMKAKDVKKKSNRISPIWNQRFRTWSGSRSLLLFDQAKRQD